VPIVIVGHRVDVTQRLGLGQPQSSGRFDVLSGAPGRIRICGDVGTGVYRFLWYAAMADAQNSQS
jgi:hypothetical protein